MSSVRLVFSSDGVRALSAMRAGDRGVVVAIEARESGRVDRLLSLGVTPGARVTVLQMFPGVVFQCDQTELAVERGVADAILIGPVEGRS